MFLRKITIIVIFVLAFFAFQASAIGLGDSVNFNVDPEYDIAQRQDVSAVLVKTTPKLYFYIESNWWNQQPQLKQNEVLNNLSSLSFEFENNIYNILTSAFGLEWKPGVDGDEKITILFQSMQDSVGGYFRNVDEYLKVQYSTSNEREMLYLPLGQIDNPKLKTYLAHEFMHLISFNQKEKTFSVSEEVWLNEARADYAPTLLGYDNQYEGSNLQKRVQAFLENPVNSLTEWQNKKYDYAVVNLFLQYLTDYYGVDVLKNSMKSKLVGIPSINEALVRAGYKEDFAQIYTNWTIALFLNDCTIGPKYCYLNNNLKTLRISPSLNYLPQSGNSSLTVTNITKNWMAEWQKFIGGSGTLKLEFKGLTGLNFKVPYIIQDKEGKYFVNFLALDKNQKGEITVQDFGNQSKSLIIISSLQSKVFGFNGNEGTYPFTFTVSTTQAVLPSEQEMIQQLLAQIDYLKKEIAKLQAQQGIITENISCTEIKNNLYYGMIGNIEVKCLQEFLKNQGSTIYPEGLVTGNFGSLTSLAVVRFQEKFAFEILYPLGLQKGTGVVGPSTRVKINKLLTGNF